MRRAVRPLLALLLAGLAAAASAAPPAAFTTAAGAPVAMRAFHGRPVLIDLWASWCAPCLPGLVELQRTADRTAPHGLAVVPISVDRGGAPAALRSYARLNLARLPLYLGDAARITAHFGVRSLPTAILFDAAGREVARFEGKAWRIDAIDAAIDRLLSAQTEGRPS